MNRAPANKYQNDLETLSDAGHRCEIVENHQTLQSVVDTLVTCARQNIALGGHWNFGTVTAATEPRSK